jgi:hypothetical protein
MQFNSLLTSIERKSNDIENLIKNFDVRGNWETILEKYSLLFMQAKNLEAEMTINSDALRIVSVLPSNRVSMEKDSEYLTSILSVYRKYNKAPINESLIPRDVKSTIKSHNAISKKYEVEFQSGLKGIQVPERQNRIAPSVKNPLIDVIFNGTGLRDATPVKQEAMDKMDEEIEEIKEEDKKIKKRKRLPGEIETLKVEEIRGSQPIQQINPQFQQMMLQQQQQQYLMNRQGPIPQIPQFMPNYGLQIPMQGYIPDPHQIPQPIPGQKPSKQVKKQ